VTTTTSSSTFNNDIKLNNDNDADDKWGRQQKKTVM
jgi:hypothetical protein